MKRAAAALAILIVTAVACAPSGAPTVKCPARAFDTAVPAEAASAAAASGLTVVTCAGAEYGLTAPGARRLSLDELGKLLERIAPELMAVDGVTAMRLDGCCKVNGAFFDPGGCIQVDIDQGTPAVARVPTLIAKLRETDGDVRFSILQGAPREPRCAQNDPACGPIPYIYSMACVDADATRDWSRERAPETRAASRQSACTHDGDCVTCNTICTGYKYRPSRCTLEFARHLEKAYCGCIDRGCAWFYMRP
jgi:hypothetical protein